MSEALFEDYELDIMCLMPTNVYGINDNFDQFNGHVIPAMITKFIQAKKNNSKQIKLLGTGKPQREFVHADDLANAILTCLRIPKSRIKILFNSSMPIINIGTGQNISILKLANIISKLVGFKGKIIFDKKFPDGTYKKILTQIKSIVWDGNHELNLPKGLRNVVDKKLF